MSEKAKQQQQQEERATKERILIAKGSFISIYQENIHLPEKEVKFDFIEHPGAVAILPIQADGTLLLIRQWRRATNTILLEVPAGKLEPGEDPLLCADRELREETGFAAGSLIRLGGIFTVPGFCNEFVHLFLARQLSKSPLWADDSDFIDLVPLAFEEVLSLAHQGNIPDSKTLAILLLYEQHLLHTKL